MSYLLGWKALYSFLREEDPLNFFKAKLGGELFRGEEETKVWDVVNGHFQKYRVLPKLETVVGHVPAFSEVEAPEPPSYYVDLLEKRYEYQRMDKLVQDVHQVLKDDKNNTETARQHVTDTLRDLTQVKYRQQILDMNADGGLMLMTAYGQQLVGHDKLAVFGWPYMDAMTNGIGPGEVVSYVGRPAQGKAAPLGSKVLTPDGFVLMGSLSVGQPLTSTDGKPSVVTGVYPQGVLPAYSFLFSDGSRCETSGEHLWEVYTPEGVCLLTTHDLRKRLLEQPADALYILSMRYAEPREVRLLSIAFSRAVECQCISVSHPSKLYVMDDYIVTHNTWFMAYGANQNWTHQASRVLFVSMEMNALQVVQRIGSIYAGVSIRGLREAQLPTPVWQRFQDSLQLMSKEGGRLFVLDGNLTANVADIYNIAYQLRCDVVYIDGAYLVKAENPRLGRYERVAENVEFMKRASGELNMATFASWQFNREFLKKSKKGQDALDTIGFSDAIGQVSSVVIGMMQEEGVETLNKRRLSVMKGRNGEIGEFDVNWNFGVMDFSQMQQEPVKKLEFV